MIGGTRWERAKDSLKSAIEACPACFTVRAQYMEGLAPRWNGSFDEMNRFAEESMRSGEGNSRIKTLRGFTYCEQARQARLENHNTEAAALAAKALGYGEYWRFYNERAAAYYNLNRFQEALTDLNRAIALRPGEGESYLQRAMTFVKLDNYDAAFKDLDLAREFNTPEHLLRECEARMAEYNARRPQKR